MLRGKVKVVKIKAKCFSTLIFPRPLILTPMLRGSESGFSALTFDLLTFDLFSPTARRCGAVLVFPTEVSPIAIGVKSVQREVLCDLDAVTLYGINKRR